MIYKLLTDLVQLGRSYRVSICFGVHEVLNRDETKSILTECHSITFFPEQWVKRNCFTYWIIILGWISWNG